MNKNKKYGSDSARTSLLMVWLAYVVLLGLFNKIFYPLLALPDSRMGHDYALTLVAWLDGFIWFRNNGLDVPWFTPSFCAGQPFFADPQSGFYSLPQFINFMASPFLTALATMWVSATLMFWGGYLLMRKVFLTGTIAAVLVGGLLMFNGFLPHRLLVGHLSYHGFALTPLIALLLLVKTNSRMNNLAAACAAGLMLAYWVHSGLGTLIVPAGLAIFMLAVVYGLAGGSLAQFAVRSALAAVIGLGVAMSKLWVAYSFLSNFPRTFYPLPGATSVMDAITILLGSLFLPSQWAFDIGAPRLTNVQWGLAPHEWAYNFGIATGLLLLALLVNRIRQHDWHSRITRGKIVLWGLLFLCLVWPLAFNLYDPTWNSFLKTIPIINSVKKATTEYLSS